MNPEKKSYWQTCGVIINTVFVKCERTDSTVIKYSRCDLIDKSVGCWLEGGLEQAKLSTCDLRLHDM